MCPGHRPSHLNNETGQAVAELALAIPLFALALLMVANVLIFINGATTFDRAVEQWSRANVANPQNPMLNSALSIWFVLGPNPSPRFQATCAISGASVDSFDSRTYSFTMYYVPIGSDVLAKLGLRSPPRWMRKKTVVAPYYRRVIAF